jgi:glutathione S-transferase
MQQFPLTALVTLLSLLLYVAMMLGVSWARRKYAVAPPAMTGDVRFERSVRVHANTLESLAVYLPSLWLFAAWWGDGLAAAMGIVWIVGRLIYWLGYSRGSGLRRLGFPIQGAANIGLLLGALLGVLRGLLEFIP